MSQWSYGFSHYPVKGTEPTIMFTPFARVGAVSIAAVLLVTDAAAAQDIPAITDVRSAICSQTDRIGVRVQTGLRFTAPLCHATSASSSSMIGVKNIDSRSPT
jgi:hypothetical protein